MYRDPNSVDGPAPSGATVDKKSLLDPEVQKLIRELTEDDKLRHLPEAAAAIGAADAAEAKAVTELNAPEISSALSNVETSMGKLSGDLASLRMRVENAKTDDERQKAQVQLQRVQERYNRLIQEREELRAIQDKRENASPMDENVDGSIIDDLTGKGGTLAAILGAHILMDNDEAPAPTSPEVKDDLEEYEKRGLNGKGHAPRASMRAEQVAVNDRPEPKSSAPKSNLEVALMGE